MNIRKNEKNNDCTISNPSVFSSSHSVSESQTTNVDITLKKVATGINIKVKVYHPKMMIAYRPDRSNLNNAYI